MAGTAADDEAPTIADAYAPGSSVGGRYRVVRFIASGGMGSVHEAEDLLLGGRVALKTLRGEPAPSPRAVERLRREIALARRITHPNVCRVYDFGEDGAQVFLTMELLDGETLTDRLRRGPLEAGALDDIAAQLVAALAAAHAQGVVHRDLKSSNIVMVGDRAVVTDFGLARAADDGDIALTAEGAMLGTPAYMAPEQVEGRAATEASDIYALGVVLYEMATGELPFREDTAMATATARLTREAPRPSSRRPTLDRRWDAVIRRCLARDPAARFARVEDVLAAPRPRRTRVWLAAAAVGLAALAISAAIAIPGGDAPRAPPPGVSRHFPATLRPRSAAAIVHVENAETALAADRWDDARDLLGQAVAADPEDPAGEAALADVLLVLGRRDQARDAATRAMLRRDQLAEPARRFVDAVDAAVRDDGPGEIAAWRALIAATSTDRAAALRLAARLAADGSTDDAAATLAPLRRSTAEVERIAIARIDATIAARRGDSATSLSRALLAAMLARAAGRNHDEGEALVLAGSALWHLGDDAGAARAYERAIAIGDSGVVLRARTARIGLDLSADRLGRVADEHLENIELVRALGDRWALIPMLEHTSSWLTHVGRVAEGFSLLDEARRLATELHSEAQLAWVDAYEGLALVEAGRLGEPLAQLEAAMLAGQRLDIVGLQGNAFHTWSEALLELDDDTALARARRLRRTAVDRLIDGVAAFREGDLARAEQVANTLANPRTGEGRIAQMILARIAIRRGELDQAEALIAPVRAGLIGDGRSPITRERLVHGEAELLAARGDLPGALAALDALAAECAAGGLHRCEVQTMGLAAVLAAGTDPARTDAALSRARAAGFHRTEREIRSSLQR